MNIVRCL